MADTDESIPSDEDLFSDDDIYDYSHLSETALAQTLEVVFTQQTLNTGTDHSLLVSQELHKLAQNKKTEIYALKLLQKMEAKKPNFSAAMDRLMQFLYNKILEINKNNSKSSLEFINQNFSDASRELPHFLNEYNALDLVCNDGMDFADLFGENELKVYETVIGIVKKMCFIQSITDAYPMLYVPMSYNKGLKTRFMRCMNAFDAHSQNCDLEWTFDYLQRFKLRFIGTKTQKDLLKLIGTNHSSDMQCQGCMRPLFDALPSTDNKYLLYRVGGAQNQFEIEYVFHGQYCLSLRKYKEAIRNYVFDKECKHRHKRVPNIYDKTRILDLFGEKDLVLCIDSATSLKLKRPKIIYKSQNSLLFRIRRQWKSAQFHFFADLIADYQCIINKINSEIATDKLSEFAQILSANQCQKVSIGDEMLQFIDFERFGENLWYFVISEIEIKQRQSLWNVLFLIIHKLSIPKIIQVLSKSKASLVRFDTTHLQTLCLSIIEKSKYPIHIALYLCHFLKDLCKYDCSKQSEYDAIIALLTRICHNLLNEIESDHLLAILLEIPCADLNDLSIINIAINYELIHFLDFCRFQPIFFTLWREFQFLNPSKKFESNKNKNYYLNLLYFAPNSWYYSPLGLFVIHCWFYILYLLVFTLFLVDSANNNLFSPFTALEGVLWVFNAGFVLYEFTEIAFKNSSKYFTDLWNYWDILLSLNWIFIALLRFVIAPYNFTVTQSKDTLICEIFIVFYCVQCVIIWTRFISTLQRTSSMGPLIQMVLEMSADIFRFFMILAIVMCGFLFAVYFVIGGDVSVENGYEQDLSSVFAVSLFIFQCLLGQQEWELIRANDAYFGQGRSRIAEGLVILFTIFGGILLLNLLIALMASTYERVRELGHKKVNFNRIAHTISCLNQNALLPPPLNLCVILFTLVWIAFNAFVKCLSLGSYSVNIQSLSPITYSLRKNLINLQSKHEHKHSYAKSNKLLDLNYSDLKRQTRNKSEVRTYSESSFVLLPKEERAQSVTNENLKKSFCRYCRQNMQNENGSIDAYFALFQYHSIVDDCDKRLMKHLLKNKRLCPICFRPYSGNSDTYYQWQVMLEIVSYYLFIALLWLPLLILLCIPALLSCLVSKLCKLSESEGIYETVNEKKGSINAYDLDLESIFDRKQQMTQQNTRNIIEQTSNGGKNAQNMNSISKPNNSEMNGNSVGNALLSIKEMKISHQNTLQKLNDLESKLQSCLNNHRTECTQESGDFDTPSLGTIDVEEVLNTQ